MPLRKPTCECGAPITHLNISPSIDRVAPDRVAFAAICEAEHITHGLLRTDEATHLQKAFEATR